MSTLLDVVERLRDTEQAIAQTEEAIAAHPEFAGSLALTLGSYARVKAELETTFQAITNRDQVDVCRYRIFEAATNPSLRVVATALRDFQEIVTTVYDALKNGPKRKMTTSVESRAASTFGFAYTFAGSLGIALTIPNDHLLTGKTTVDGTMETIFSILRSDEPADIRHYATELGPAPIKLVYQWAKAQAEAGIGTELQWMRNDTVREDVILQHQELERLERIIAQTSDVTVSTILMRARLVGIDSKTRTFHLEYEGGDLKGRLADDVANEASVAIPAVYDVIVHVEAVTVLATGRESSAHTLVLLTPITGEVV